MYYRMHTPEIGQRALEAVKAMAVKNGTSVAEECRRIGAYQEIVYKWGRGAAPSGEWFDILYHAGYDIVWIITGESTKKIDPVEWLIEYAQKMYAVGSDSVWTQRQSKAILEAAKKLKEVYE
jgi:hypothetical protein